MWIYTLSIYIFIHTHTHISVKVREQKLSKKKKGISINEQPNQKTDRRSQETFLQRRHTDGQKAHETVLNITNY